MSILHKLPLECRLARQRGRSAREEAFQDDPAAEAYEEAINAINYVREEQRHAVEREPDHDELARLVRIEKLALELADAWRAYIEGRSQ